MLYYPVNDSVLLEYRHFSTGAGQTVPLGINEGQAAFLKIQTGINPEEPLWINWKPTADPSDPIERVIDTTAIRISSDVWLQLDSAQGFDDFKQVAPDLDFIPKYQGQTGLTVKYDRVRLYFAQGWGFSSTSGLVMDAIYESRNSKLRTFVASKGITNASTEWKWLVTPLYYRQRAYLKYIEIWIPSLESALDTNRQLPNDFLFDPATLSRLRQDSALYEGDSTLEPRIRFRFWQINDIVQSFNNQTFLYCSAYRTRDDASEVSIEIPHKNNTDSISAWIAPSQDGDFFEYGPRYNGEAFSTWAIASEKSGAPLTLTHTIRVFEQVTTDAGDVSELPSSVVSHTSISAYDSDAVYYYRPIIKNPSAIGFVLQYEFDMFNEKTRMRTVKTATLLDTGVKKYGARLAKIQVAGVPHMTVKNVIATSVPDEAQSIREHVAMPAMFMNRSQFAPAQSPDSQTGSNWLLMDTYNISAIASTSIVDPDGQSLDQGLYMNPATIEESTTILGNGRGLLNLNPINNFILIRIFEKTGKTFKPIKWIKNSDTARVNLVFIDNQGNRTPRVSTLQINGVNSGEGVFLFNIPASVVKQLQSYETRNFYLTLTNFDSPIANQISYAEGVDHVIWSGKWYIGANAEEFKQLVESKRIGIIDQKLEQLQTAKSELQAVLDTVLKVAKETELSKDPGILLAQREQMTQSQVKFEEAVLNTAIADNLAIAQTELIKQIRESFNRGASQ
jgi:hypothetical protein